MTSSPPLRTAVFCHDMWHPAALIRQGLAPLARDEFLFEWLDTPAAWRDADLRRFGFFVLAKGNTTGADDESPWLTPEIENAFTEQTHAGKGLLIIHAGTCYAKNPKLRALTGGAFLKHPPPCPVALEPRLNHPVTRGVSPTTLYDEHYEMVLDDDQADVFLHTRSAYGIQPAGWTRQENGRICVLTPGHTEAAWLDLQFQRLLDNGLRWSAGKIS